MLGKKEIRMIMAGIFCAGVLMGGLGTGIAFAEFSGFAYQPVAAPPEAFQTETFTYVLPEEKDIKIGLERYLGGTICKMESRKEIPKGQAKIFITYNTQSCSIEFVDYLDYEDNVRLRFYVDYGDDFENFMKVKDDFLEGLRNGEFRDFHPEHIKSVEVQVNPEDKERFYWN